MKKRAYLIMRYLLILFLLVPFCVSQVEHTIDSSTQVMTLFRNMNWTQLANGGVGHDWVFKPLAQAEQIAFYFNYSGASSLTNSVSANNMLNLFVTGDVTATGLIGSQFNKWHRVGLSCSSFSVPDTIICLSEPVIASQVALLVTINNAPSAAATIDSLIAIQNPITSATSARLQLNDSGSILNPPTAQSSNSSQTSPQNILATGLFGIDSTTLTQMQRIGSAKNITGRSQLEVVTIFVSYANVNGITTGTSVKSGIGMLHSVNVNTQVANATIRVLDLNNVGCTGSPTTPTIAFLTLPATVSNGFTLTFDTQFSNGICVVTSAATDITVTYN